jgi:hypothetical protein
MKRTNETKKRGKKYEVEKWIKKSYKKEIDRKTKRELYTEGKKNKEKNKSE